MTDMIFAMLTNEPVAAGVLHEVAEHAAAAAADSQESLHNRQNAPNGQVPSTVSDSSDSRDSADAKYVRTTGWSKHPNGGETHSLPKVAAVGGCCMTITDVCISAGG